jgi:hypothetical protein
VPSLPYFPSKTMAEETKKQEVTQEPLLEMIQKLMAGQPQAGLSQSPFSAWSQQPATPELKIESVAIPLNVSTPKGKLRVYLNLPGEIAESPDTLFKVIETLDAQGLPLDFWVDKSNWGKKKGGWKS